ncbi:MAG TPA: universal stress protein [Gaiellaceae bacterium]|nr:universal stress protein [Gaiellaceae bacterium]
MKRIILGYDASPASERALQRTIELATTFHAPVVVASVAPVHEFALRGVGTHYDPADPPALHTSMAKDATAKLTEHGVEAEPVTGLGHTAETLVDLADTREADLIVVGMSSRDVLTRVFGAVSDDVAHEAHCDVLLVH